MNFNPLLKFGFKHDYDQYSRLEYWQIQYPVKNQEFRCVLSIDSDGLVQFTNEEQHEWIDAGFVNSVAEVKKLYFILTGKKLILKK